MTYLLLYLYVSLVTFIGVWMQCTGKDAYATLTNIIIGLMWPVFLPAYLISALINVGRLR